MAHEYNPSPSSLDKPAEHPAKAIMAKRWEERRAEARARRIAQMNLGDSGLIPLSKLAGHAEAEATSVAADSSSVSALAPFSEPAADSGEVATVDPSEPAAESGGAAAAPVSLVEAPIQLQQAQVLGAPAASPSLLRDPRKAMLVVAVVSHCLLLALLYFGGFLAR